MAVGGYPLNTPTVEVIDMSNDTLTCQNLAIFPNSGEGSVATFINDNALVCGGKTDSQKCFSYDKEVKHCKSLSYK